MKERQREYEIVYLLRPDVTDEQVDSIRDRLEHAIDDVGGHELTYEDWGTRDLAYEIRDESSGRKFEQARYQYLRYLAPGQDSKVAEDELKFVEETLKYLTVKLDDDLIPDERLAEPVEQSQGERIPYESSS